MQGSRSRRANVLRLQPGVPSVVMSRLQIRFALGSVVLAIATITVGCAEDNNSPVAPEPAPTTTTIAATTTTVTPTTTVELSPEFVVLIGDYSWGRSEGVANLQEVLGIRADGEYGPKTPKPTKKLSPTWESRITTSHWRRGRPQPRLRHLGRSHRTTCAHRSLWNAPTMLRTSANIRGGGCTSATTSAGMHGLEFDQIKIDYGDGRSYTPIQRMTPR